MLVRRTCAGLILIRQDHYRRCATFVDRRRLWLVAIGFASGQPSGAEACATRRRSYIGPLHLSRSSLRSLYVDFQRMSLWPHCRSATAQMNPAAPRS